MLVIYTNFCFVAKFFISKLINDTIVSVDLIDEQTLNPVPSVGNISWNYTVTNTETIENTIYASVSSELLYKKRYIRAELGTKIQE